MAADLVTGLDIGIFSIKVVVLSHKGKAPRLIAYGSIPAPQPGLASEADVDLEAVALAIKNVLAAVKAPNNSVVAALPESKIFTRIISDLPFLTDEEISSAIKYSAEEFVPLPTDQVELYWQVVDRSKQQNRTSVLVIATPKNVQKKYLKVLTMADVQPIALETDMIASSRALVGSPYAPTTIIMDIGATSTDFAVVSKGLILFTRSIGTGGLSLTRAISQYLNFETVQAEEYKRVYGMLSDQLEGKIYQVLKPVVDVIASEAERVIQAFQIKNPKNPIKRLVLTGGGAKLPGLVVYLASRLALEIQEADPWYSVEKDTVVQPKLAADATQYAVAVGLALRNE